MSEEMKLSNERLAEMGAAFTVETTEVGNLYYFSPLGRAKPPYRTQRHVNAIIDIADDGTLAGVELIVDMPPPPKLLRASSGVEVKGLEWRVLDNGTAWSNVTVFGLAYFITPDGTWAHRNGSPNKVGTSLDEAKAAAEADYRQRILSCLSSPLPTVEVTGRDALQAIANLPHNGNEAGHEEAYRAVEVLFAKSPFIWTAEQFSLDEEKLDTIIAIGRNQLSGRVTEYELKELVRVYRAALSQNKGEE